MSNTSWNNIMINLATTMNKLSAACVGFEIMSRMPYGCPCIFQAYRPMTGYMPYSPMYQSQYQPGYQYPGYQYPGYQSPYPGTPSYTPKTAQPGQITSAEAIQATHSQNLGRNIVNGNETQFTSDSWTTLSNKADKTSAEDYQLHSKYRAFLGNLSKSFTAFLDNCSIGNKDGYISKNEFVEYYLTQFFTPEEIQANEQAVQDKKTAAEKIFNSMDLTKEGKLDWKEMSASFALADISGVNGKYDGKIMTADMRKALQSIHDGGTTTETKLKQNYSEIFDFRA